MGMRKLIVGPKTRLFDRTIEHIVKATKTTEKIISNHHKCCGKTFNDNTQHKITLVTIIIRQYHKTKEFYSRVNVDAILVRACFQRF